MRDWFDRVLVENWAAILKHAWSVRLMLLAALLSGIEVTIQVMLAFTVKPPIPPGVFAALAGFITIAACVARFVAQSKVSGEKPDA